MKDHASQYRKSWAKKKNKEPLFTGSILFDVFAICVIIAVFYYYLIQLTNI